MSRALGTGPDIVILELGSNDRSNGIPPQQTEDNLDQMIARFQKTHIAVVLAGTKPCPVETMFTSALRTSTNSR